MFLHLVRLEYLGANAVCDSMSLRSLSEARQMPQPNRWLERYANSQRKEIV
jgi:hypothetical protein